MLIGSKFAITAVSALEVLDSRGDPTLQVDVRLASGAEGRASVPSGAPTRVPSGAPDRGRPAVELRDGDLARYGGLGVTRAVGHVNGELADLLRSRSWRSLAGVDRAMVEADGTSDKRRLGANAIIGVSMAVARGLAAGGELVEQLNPPGVSMRIPVPYFAMVSGRGHAPGLRGARGFRGYLAVPIGAPSMPEAVRAGAAVYASLRGLLHAAGLATGLGDDGGFVPELTRPEDVLTLLVRAIEAAGYVPGPSGVAIALDAAADVVHTDGVYRVDGGGVARGGGVVGPAGRAEGEGLTGADMIERYGAMVRDFPVWSIEDGLAETDPDGLAALTERVGATTQVVDSGIVGADPAVLARAVTGKVATAALVVPAQVGTVTETLEAMQVCRDAGVAQMVSDRPGDTEDAFIADLAVATGCGQLTAGAPARGERVATYNRLLEIAARHPLPFGVGQRRFSRAVSLA